MDRIVHDTKMVRDIGKLINIKIKEDDIIRVVRLGKKAEGENNKNNRPLLINFSNDTVKKNLFLNVSTKLKEVSCDLGSVSIDHDTTSKEKEKEETSAKAFIFCHKYAKNHFLLAFSYIMVQ